MNSPKDLLVYYFKRVWMETDLRWDSDNHSEIESIIEGVYDEIDQRIEKALSEYSAPVAGTDDTDLVERYNKESVHSYLDRFMKDQFEVERIDLWDDETHEYTVIQVVDQYGHLSTVRMSKWIGVT
jgi:hypothetical protein